MNSTINGMVHLDGMLDPNFGSNGQRRDRAAARRRHR
jgi:hypothetical protein